MEDEVRVGLGHRADVGNIVSHNHVRQSERGGRSERQVTDRQTDGLAAMFGDHDDVSDVVGATCRHQLLDLVVATVDALRVGKQQLDFLQHT